MIPRAEYPRPQFAREEWLCLNGEWEFEIDAGDSGLGRGLLARPLRDRILVPFCPESSLSGVGCVDFMPAVWYRRQVRIPETWQGRRVLLHFQAVDYDATVWVNGSLVGRHRGGFTPFTCDLQGVAEPGETITIVVRARDDARSPQPRGKQSQRYENYGCLYTRTTGIWQTVWLEPVPATALQRPRLTPDLALGLVRLEQSLDGSAEGLTLRDRLSDDGGPICSVESPIDTASAPHLDLPISAGRRRPWSVADPHLYDVEIELLDASGAIVDRARSYAGLRSVGFRGKAFVLNGQVLFQRLVLDQGYYPDGILTAPDEESLVRDILLAQEAGFNGARLHEKVFEERFLYHADRLGYLVWGEFPDWGAGGQGPADDHHQPGPTYITQWLEVLARDYSHPTIVGWCPLNETDQPLGDRITVLDDVTRAMFLATKAIDSTRPVLDASGYSHRVPESDVYDCHDYEQDPAAFAENHAGLAGGQVYYNGSRERPWSIPYRGQPFFVSEFGGIWWNPDPKPGEQSWGYGPSPENLEEFYQRFDGLCSVLLDNEEMFGYCYTQLTDVCQEQNGIYTFDRRQKFDVDRLRRVQERMAAIEARGATQAAIRLTGTAFSSRSDGSREPGHLIESEQVEASFVA
jgi:beta-galactosidase/beta-glucuronidase